MDRVVQQAIAQILIPLYEPQFSDHSYGFRPKRNSHQALTKCRDYITEGYVHAVDLDLEKFFDNVNHVKLAEVLSRTITDGRVVSLIHKYQNAGVQVSRSIQSSEMGVPQGGPLSPLWSNIMLNELDKEMERRGHKFVRYADDIVIQGRSKRSAERVRSSIIRFIEDKMFLKVNYFKPADMQKQLLRIERWYRKRIRMVIWKQWKRIRTKLENLVKPGADKTKAWQWANTRKS